MHKETHHMPLSSFLIDETIAENLVGPETKENRIVRSQLRLSDRWKVLGKTLGSGIGELSDEFPGIPLTERSCEGYEADVTIRVAWNRDSHLCPCCGHRCRILCYESREYRHVDDLGCRCFIHVEVPKYDCAECGSTVQQPFPLAESNVSYTRPFAIEVVKRLREDTVKAVADSLATSRDIVGSILRRAIRRALPEQDLSYVNGVYVDETQFGSGHDYISVFLDQRHRVIFACRGHGKDVLEQFRDHLVIQGGDPESVRFFSADMSGAYESGIAETFPNATLVWDRFHLMKSVNEALNDVRKGVVRRGKDEPLKLIKYTLLLRRSRMRRKHVERLRQIRVSAPELALAFDMKETFAEIIKVPDAEAMERALRIWAEWVMLDGPEQLKRKAKTFLEKIDHIVSWATFRVSNSVSEGVNKRIQDIRRNAYGYRNVQCLFDMILLRLGDLHLRF